MSEQPQLPAKRPNGAPPKNTNAQRIGGKLRECLVALATGRAVHAASAADLIGGITERAVQRALHKPHVQAELHKLIKQDLRTTGVIRARDAYLHLMEKAESEYVRADLAKDGLAQAGVRDKVDGSQQRPLTGGVRVTFITHAAQNGATAVQVDIEPDKIVDGSTT